MMRLAALVLALFALPASALAWGATGHRIVGRLAAEAFPEELPAFLRTERAAVELGELSREPDRTKGAGKVHDQDRDAAHFVDADALGLIMGGPPLDDLPATRADYEAALAAAGTDSWRAGYLPHALVDGWLQLAKDFAYWRVLTAALAREENAGRRAWYEADLARREALILRDLGYLSHYVADAGQPLHVSVHYNGWSGDNPHGFTIAKIHGPFEGAFVRANVTAEAVRAKVAPFAPCECRAETRITALLTATHATVEPFYALEKAGGFEGADPRGVDFAAERLAASVSALRDLVVEAWRASANGNVGWTPVGVAAVEAGQADPYESLIGVD